MLRVEFTGYLHAPFQPREVSGNRLIYTARIGLRNSAKEEYLWTDLVFWPADTSVDTATAFHKKFGLHVNEFSKGSFVYGKGRLAVRKSNDSIRYSVYLEELELRGFDSDQDTVSVKPVGESPTHDYPVKSIDAVTKVDYDVVPF